MEMDEQRAIVRPRLETMDSEEFRLTLGIARSTFYQLARKDGLPVPTIRVGKRLMFSRRAVEAMLDRQQDNQANQQD